MRAFIAGLLTGIFWLGLYHPAAARIGETLDQVLKHYGRCLRTVTAENGMVYKLFSKGGFKILVHFYENKVDEISYGKDTDIFDDELKALMQDNAPGQWSGSGWPVYSWHNASGISARYSFEHRIMTIMTDAALEREKKRAKDTQNGPQTSRLRQLAKSKRRISTSAPASSIGSTHSSTSTTATEITIRQNIGSLDITTIS